MLIQFSIKAQNPHIIRTCKIWLLQKNLQLCYNVILNVESLKPNNIILFFFTFWFLSHLVLFQCFSFTLSLSLSLSLSHKAPPSLILTLSLISHLSFSCTIAGLGLWSRHGDRCGFWILDWHGSTEIGDRGGLCLDQWAMWVVGQVVGLELWVKWWVWIGGSVYHGSSGDMGLDWWVS